MIKNIVDLLEYFNYVLKVAVITATCLVVCIS